MQARMLAFNIAVPLSKPVLIMICNYEGEDAHG